MAREALAILGATATGKSALAVAVARCLDGEIISVDSRQVYRGMDIGTAKPAHDERDGIPHHGFDLLTPAERFNAGRFADMARTLIGQIAERGRVPILAGGTGFFLRALTHPLFDEPGMEGRRREQWKRFLADMTTAELVRWATVLDSASRVRAADRQRLARVIEVATLTGRPLSWWQRRAPSPAPAIDPVIFVLDLPREALVRRIEDRTDEMLRAGLVEEVRALLDRGYDEDDPGMHTTGYIELIPYVRGLCSLDEAVSRVNVATRQYARRQRIWFRNQLPAGAHWLDASLPRERLVETITRVWTEAGE
jgi:tRNA dimethylallyltransferase